MYEDYGNLAGFMGFAGAADTSPTPVVRYQDLHRSHAPASAGALAVYENPNASMRQGDFEENLDGFGDVAYGDVAYGDVPAPPPEFAGVQPLPVPKNVPAYGATPSADKIVSEYPVLANGAEGDLVRDLQERLIKLGFLSRTKKNGESSADGIFGDGTEKALKAFQKGRELPQSGATSIDTWLALYNLQRPSTTKPTTSRDAAKEAEDKSSPYWEQLLYSAGIARAKDAQKVSGDTFAPSVASAPAGPDWQKIALWSGVAIGGIAITYFVVKAIRN